MAYILNTTNDYHIRTLNTLGWELTLCAALHPEDSPAAGQKNRSRSNTAFPFLEKIIPLTKMFWKLAGTRHLMRDFLSLALISGNHVDVSLSCFKKKKPSADFRNVKWIFWNICPIFRSFDFIIWMKFCDFPPDDEHQPKQNDPETICSIKRMTDYVEEFILNLPRKKISISEQWRLWKIMEWHSLYLSQWTQLRRHCTMLIFLSISLQHWGYPKIPLRATTNSPWNFPISRK